MLDRAQLAADAAGMIDALADSEAVIAGAVRIPVVFDRGYALVLGVESAGPAIRFQTARWPDASHGDVIDIGEARYRIVTVEPDGLGLTTCHLELQP